jgi:hypothetical protein
MAPVLMVAFADGLHGWLPGKPQKSYGAFRSVMELANVSKIALLRHGQTAPSTGVDFDRVLTDLGREQANQAGAGFGRDLGPFAPRMLVSPAPRTVETAEIFKAAAGQQQVQLKPVQPLYDGTMQPKGSALFKKLGYAPLLDYLTNSVDQERQDAQKVLGAYAHVVVDEIMIECTEKEISQPAPCTLWMVGHAIYLPAAALGIASLLDCEGLDIILSSNTKEAEGFLVDLRTNSVQHMSRT